MADNGDDAGDTGEFVFGDGRTTDDEGSAAAGSTPDIGNIIAVALLVVAVVGAIVVVVTAVVSPLGMDGASGQQDGSPGASAGTTATTGATSDTNSTETGTIGEPTPATATATRTATQATPATATRTATQATPATTGGGNGTENATATPGERSPVIESFTVTDRSGGGAAIFEVAWNVSDPDRDLVAVEVALVADPAGETSVIERRRFDATGARSAGSTTFEVPGGGGAVYEVRIVVRDASGNTAFQLTRAVADGTPDE